MQMPCWSSPNQAIPIEPLESNARTMRHSPCSLLLSLVVRTFDGMNLNAIFIYAIVLINIHLFNGLKSARQSKLKLTRDQLSE